MNTSKVFYNGFTVVDSTITIVVFQEEIRQGNLFYPAYWIIVEFTRDLNSYFSPTIIPATYFKPELITT